VFLFGQVILFISQSEMSICGALPKQDPLKHRAATPPIDPPAAMSMLNRLDTTQLEAL